MRSSNIRVLHKQKKSAFNQSHHYGKLIQMNLTVKKQTLIPELTDIHCFSGLVTWNMEHGTF